MLSAAKHLSAYRDRPFAALRVTGIADTAECPPDSRAQTLRAPGQSGAIATRSPNVSRLNVMLDLCDVVW